MTAGKAAKQPPKVIKLQLIGGFYGAHAPSFHFAELPSSVTFGDSFPQGKPKAQTAMLSG